MPAGRLVFLGKLLSRKNEVPQENEECLGEYLKQPLGMLKLALPKGRLLPETAAWLERAGWRLEEYSAGSRSYRPRLPGRRGISFKVFQERDIPVQVAIGNYDLGICGADWLEELLAGFPSSPVLKVRDLGYGAGNLHLAASQESPYTCLERVRGNGADLRLAGEYPNLAEATALRLRLRRFRVFPLWGSAQVYPPEDADLVLVRAGSAAVLEGWGLVSLLTLGTARACLIAHRRGWQEKDMSLALSPLLSCPPGGDGEGEPGLESAGPALPAEGPAHPCPPDSVRLALPDGHQQEPAAAFLRRAGLEAEGYARGERRPYLGLEGVAVKVIRPQDMPLQVACGNYDLAVTGNDWLLDHLSRFPSSPVVPLRELGFGGVRVVAVTSQSLPVSSVAELRRWLEKEPGGQRWLRVASEYVNLADQFARDHHLRPYRVIPTWGASEAFLPEDADLLIENTQTGQTLARHRLQVLEELFSSTACLIGHRSPAPERRERIERLVAVLAQGLG